MALQVLSQKNALGDQFPVVVFKLPNMWKVCSSPENSIPFIFQCHLEFQNIKSACGLFVICFIPIATFTVYGREIFIYLDLKLLRIENIQSDIYAQDYGAN